MRLHVGKRILVVDAPGPVLSIYREALTFPNPAYLDAQKMGRWTGKIPRLLKFYEDADGGMLVPRGFGRRAMDIAESYGIPPSIQDYTRIGLYPQSLTFHGKLKPFQEEAVDAVLSRPIGTLCAPTGSGKTVMALAVVAKRRQRSMIVVHTRELQNQWVDRIETFLGIPACDIGIIGGGKKEVGEQITVAMVQTLYKCADEVAAKIGHLIVDECHRCSSRTFVEAVTAFDARYLLGLSATPWRRDGLSKLIYWHLGDQVHKIEKGALEESGDILRAEVVWRDTDFDTDFDPSEEYAKMLSELTQDPRRNALIADDVAGTRNGGTILVLSDRKAHVYAIRSMLEARGVPSVALTGEMNATARAEALEAIRERNARVLVATGQLIGEGFDLPAMGVLFLTTPIRFDGRVIQYLGRVLRPAPGKGHAIVYDYRDSLVGPLLSSANARARLYDRAAQSNSPDALGHTAKIGTGQEVEAPVGIAAGGES